MDLVLGDEETKGWADGVGCLMERWWEGGMGDLESCEKARGVYVYYLKIRS